MKHHLRILMAVLLCTCAACATLVRSDRVDMKELMTSQTLEGAFGRAQRAVIDAGLQITETHVLAWTFLAGRPTGETVEVRTTRMALGTLVTIKSIPPHDITDIVAAYQHET